MVRSGWDGVKLVFKVISGIGTVFLGLFVLFFLMIIWMASGTDEAPSVPRGAALVLAPEGFVVEQVRTPDPLEVILEEYDYAERPPETSLHDILTAVKRAKDDDRIEGLVISTDYMMGAAPASLHAIADAVRDFKSSDKPVYAVSTSYGQGDYLFAAEADTVYMNPYGNILMSGYGRYQSYYKGLVDMLDLTVNVFRVGTFKSAVEPFIREDMSPAAKEANRGYLDVLWGEYTSSIERARDMEAGKLGRNLQTISANLAAAEGDFAQMASNDGLVDQVVARHVWRQELAQRFGVRGGDFKQIDFRDYLLATANKAPSSSNHIAVIVAQGQIIMGEAGVEFAAAETIVRQIRRARENRRVKAIVLRVDSPGGSAFASELIRQELLAAQAEGKKVIASFGSMAASGGYWISASADEIWAEPTSITGSIGIFGVIPTFENTLKKAGITSDGVGTTELAGGFNPAMGLSDTVKDIIQQNVEQGYRRFLTIVSQSRGMTIDEVDQIAQGRVWAGRTAKDYKLVDHLGGLDEAVAAAARAASIDDDYQAVFYRDQISSFDQMLIDSFTTLSPALGRQATLPASPSPMAKLAAEIKKQTNFLSAFNDPTGHYALCLTCEIR